MLDVERYGWGSVFAQGTRDAPYYTDLTAMPLEVNSSLKERLKIEEAFHPLLNGGHLSLIELKESEDSPEKLIKMTKHIIHSYKIGAYAFTKSYSYCANCQRIFNKLVRKCPACKSVRAFTQLSRLSSKYLPLGMWPISKKEIVNKRVDYISN
jgi:anaerobic ribonucleoside-triphosphate reductase